MFRDAVALPAKCFVQGDTRASESRCSFHTSHENNGTNSGFRGHDLAICLCSAVIGVVNGPKISAQLKRGRGNFRLMFVG
jgi:hypothetical protein